MTSPAPQFLLLNNGQRMPTMGFGCLLDTIVDPDEESVINMIDSAVDIGYRHIDTAQVYGTEKAVGLGVKKVIDSGKVTREELFITTKLWSIAARQADIVASLKRSLERLALPYVDLFLIHWPTVLKQGEVMFPKDETGQWLYAEDVDYLDTWKGMEECVDLGLTKSIGISNFNSKQIQRLLDNCRIPPANIQIEIHPYLSNTKLTRFCLDKGIAVSAYAPLAGFNEKKRKENGWPTIYTDPVIEEIAKKHNCTPAQVALQYLLKRGFAVLPKSIRKERLLENYQSLHVELTDEDMTSIAALDRNMRLCDECLDHLNYPFKEEF